MNTVAFPNLDEIETQAASWLAMLDHGVSAAEAESLNIWLSESQLHGRILVKCASNWDLLGVLKPYVKSLPSDAAMQVSSIKDDADLNSRKFWPSAHGFALTAAFMMAVIGFVLGGSSFNAVPSGFEAFPSTAQTEAGFQGTKNQNERYKTRVGEISNVSLIDGSSLKLNTDSEVIVQYSEQQRQIVLVRGEVFFDVAKDPNRPFVVNVDNERVTALGTAFNIDLNRRDGTEVIVTEGKVRVNRAPQDIENRYQDVFLTPGQKVNIRDNNTRVSVNQDLDTLLSWHDGIIVFEGESLENAIREIDRYTPLSFKIIDQDIASIQVGGFFRTGDLDQLLLVLERNFGIQSSRSGEQVFLSKIRN